MKASRDIKGQRRGNLEALEFFDIVYVGSKNSPKHRWKFICDCGKEHIARKDSFLRGGHTSCGCKMSQGASSGDTFGKWTVITEEYSNGRKYYRCKCQCGLHSLIQYSDLVKNKSTQCIDCGLDRYEANNQGDSARRKVFNAYVRNAKSHGREFEITFEEFKNLIDSPCHYSGHAPMSIAQPLGNKRGRYASILYNGLDRKDNSKGYTMDNVVTCCAPCNRAKRAMPLEQWNKWLEGFNTKYYGVNN